MEGAGYEFSTVENETIGKAATWIGFWSWVAIIVGLVSGIGSVVSFDPGGIIMGVVYVVVGFYYRSAAASMRSVVETTGDDVAHLMTALDKLASAFKVMGVLVIIGVAAGLLAAILGGTAALLGG